MYDLQYTLVNIWKYSDSWMCRSRQTSLLFPNIRSRDEIHAWLPV